MFVFVSWGSSGSLLESTFLRRLSEGLKPHMYGQELTLGVYESWLLSGDGAQGLVHTKHALPVSCVPAIFVELKPRLS